MALFQGFDKRLIDTGGASINLRVGGSGPPVLLLHGYPQTHVMWHRVAPALARRFTVICADLRGYGDSSRPASDATHRAYSKRSMAADMAQVMTMLGHERFAVAGHDRGGRVSERLARDYRDRVTRLAVLDIIPMNLTPDMFRKVDGNFGRDTYHWFFLSQPFDLPERLITPEAAFYLEWTLRRWGGQGDWLAPEALAEYIRCFSDPSSVHATCEDYRAGVTIDAEDNAADNGPLLDCPVLSIWGKDSAFGPRFDPMAFWRTRAHTVVGQEVPGGHFIAEESGEAVAETLDRHFAA